MYLIHTTAQQDCSCCRLQPKSIPFSTKFKQHKLDGAHSHQAFVLQHWNNKVRKDVLRTKRPKQPSHASFIQKELAIVELPVLSVMRPPQQMQPKRVQVHPQRPLQRRQQQSHLSCLALRQPRCANPVVLVPQRVSSGLD